MGMQFQNLSKNTKWSSIVLFFINYHSFILQCCILKKELPIFVPIININLLLRVNISSCHQKGLIFSHQLDGCIAIDTFHTVQLSILSIFLVLWAHEMIGFPFYNIIGQWTRSSTDYTVVFTQVQHFVFVTKGFDKAILCGYHKSIIFSDVLVSFDGLSCK
jgi:hypothetical protein